MCTEGREGHTNPYALYAASIRYCHLQYVVNGFMGHKPSGVWETTGIPSWKPLGFLLIQHIDVEVFNNTQSNHVQIFQNHRTWVPQKEGLAIRLWNKNSSAQPSCTPPERQWLLSLMLPGPSQGISARQRPISTSTEEHRGLKAGSNPNKGLRGSSYFNKLQIV